MRTCEISYRRLIWRATTNHSKMLNTRMPRLAVSVLVSKASNLPAIQTALKKAGVRESQVVDMSQGNKQSRFVAWTFHDKEQQQLWREKNWK